MEQEKKTAPQERGAVGVMCWAGEPGPQGCAPEGYELKTDYESGEDLDAILLETEESMRRGMLEGKTPESGREGELLSRFPDGQ